ncbi:hypothetical protein M8C21_025713 [Ambrosia artemisiifolia]|uniref:Uncharacterized protein n=1 Tax=Ambrosia artemisiifolia TaxID=4212 RepID=A0AAD5C8Q3_AMBAR|nr:hypothetical protein M8C21_025713 [Ambrosia artemisiifolia]
MERGSRASKDEISVEATNCFSCALEIRELVPECVRSYYKYGCALLYKPQEDYDLLGVENGKASISSKAKEGTSNVQAVSEGDCELEVCHVELIHPPEDCNVNSQLIYP